MDANTKDTTGNNSLTEKVYEHEAGIRQIASFNSDRFHVKSSLEEWLNTHYDSLETVIIDEADLPRFEFNVKIQQQQQQKRRDVYIPCCAIARLKQLQTHQRAHKIAYSAPSLIKFAFNYGESDHWLKAHEIPKNKRKKHLYREPYDEHVARLVASGYHRADDRLVEMGDQDVVYYFLSVLRCVNCNPLSRALAEARKRGAAAAGDHGLYQSAVLPGRLPSRSSGPAKYYTLYAEIVHFLGLMSPPMRIGDRNSDIVEKVRRRNVEQTRQLCDAVGIAEYTITDRGREWLKIVKFFDANPDFCAVIGAAVVEADDTALTVIEKQTLQQVRKLWMWRKMQDFYNCYAFASRRTTAVHKMAVMVEQCDDMERRYRRLIEQAAKGDEQLAPFASFYLPEKQLQTLANVEVYPELLYAAVSTSVKTKRGNSGWEQFVATRPARIPRDEIERLLAEESAGMREANANRGDDEDEFEGAKSSGCCSSNEVDYSHWHRNSDQELEDAGYFQTDFSHFETENMDEVRTERLVDGLGLVDVEWDAVVANDNSDAADVVEWDVCDGTVDNTFPEGSGPFSLASYLNDGAENNGDEKSEKNMEPK